MQGEMLWFNEAKDHGFILTEEGERLAVAGSGFAGEERPVGRCARKIVSFEVDDSNDPRQAQNVVFVPEVAPRRARRRSAGRGVRH
jgi:'Cold-shock' DNA-binding domain